MPKPCCRKHTLRETCCLAKRQMPYFCCDKESPMSVQKTKESEKKPHIRERRHSVQASITRVFSVTIIIIVLAVGISAFRIQSNRIIQSIERDALSALSLVRSAVNDINFSDEISAGKYASTRIRLRDICQAMDMQYISIYSAFNNNKDLFFYFCVANTDEDDSMVRAQRGYGSIAVNVELNEAEKAALEGDTSAKRWSMDNEYGKVLAWTIPIFDYRHNVVALMTADCLVESFDSQIISSIVSILALSVLLLFLSMGLELLLLRKRIFIPLAKISRQMFNFASGDSLKTEPLNITSQDEIQEIADSFTQMTADIQIYMTNQEHSAEERAQVKAQLELARNIQYGMVPAAFHQANTACEVSAFMRPAREVGGDFYDCFFRKDGNLCALMADVSGKGITAALFMAMAKSILHELLSLGFSPAEALNRANDELCSQNPEGMFVTVFATVLDIRTGVLTVANAGHNPPVLFGKGGSRIYTPNPGIALGLFEDAGIEDETLILSPGEGIFLYTDGITEAVSKDKQFYGIDRLTELFASAPSSMQEALSEVILSVDTFSEDMEQFDDMTIAAVLFTGVMSDEQEPALASGENDCESVADSANFKGGAMKEPTSFSMEERNDPVDFELSGKLGATLDDYDLLKEKLCSVIHSANLGKILLAAEEAFVNIVDYSGATFVEYRIQKSGQRLTLTYMDDGKPFDPFASRPSKDFDDFDTGGMGISLICQIAEQSGWERKAGFNCLTLVFLL